MSDGPIISAPESIQPLSVGIRQAARLLGMSERTVWDLVSAGKIPHIQPGGKGGKILFRVATLDRWLADNETTAPRQPAQPASTTSEADV